MQAHEWSNGDISPEITFTADDGRKFGKKFSMNLKVNTAPVLEYAGIGKTATPDSAGNHYYVLIFCAKDMGTMIGTQHVHKDINIMNVTAGGVSRPPIALSVTGSDFATGGDLLAAVSQLDTAHPLPTGNGLLRLKTDVKVGGPEKVYEVCIKDEQGLSSEVIRASTQKNKLSDVKLFDGPAEIGETSISVGATESSPKEFPGINGKTLTAKAAPAGAGITGKVEKSNGYGTWTEISGGTVSGTTPVTITLPALGTGEDEALYKISLKAQLSGYDDSDSKDFFVKLVRQEVPVLKLVQNFSSNSPYEKNISTAAKGYVTEDIIPFAGNYNSSTNALVIYNLNGRAAFVIAPRTGSGAAVKYKLGVGPETSSTTPARIQLPGTGPYKLEVWAVKGTEGPHTTVHINVVNAVSNYTQLKNVVKNAPAGNEIQINIGGNLTALSGYTEIEVSGGKKLKLIPSSGSSICKIDADGKGRIFKISGSGTVLNLEDIKLEGGYDAYGKGGAVHVKTGGKLVLKGNTVITPSAGGGENTPGKNDVYLVSGASIRVDGALTTIEPIVARITPQNYTETTQVLIGPANWVSTNCTKFSVTQRDDGFLWTIKNNGTLKAIHTTINGSSGAWQRLKEAVQTLPEGSTITVNGTINATNDFGDDDRGVIDITKNITIQGKTGANSDMLNANRGSLGSYAHPIFRVSGGKTLTLKNLTLKGGKGIAGGTLGGGAILIPSGSNTAELTDCVIEDCTADKGGAIGCGKGGTVKLTNTTIKKCKASGSGNTGSGGAIYAEGATVTMTGCTLTGNKAKSGGAIYAQKAGAPSNTPSTVTISGGTIGGTEAADANKATGAYTDGGGGGIYIGEDCTLTMKAPAGSPAQGVQVIGNTAVYNGAGIYTKGTLTTESCTITDNKTTGASTNTGGGGVYVESGSVEIKDATKIYHNYTDASGGGIYVNAGTVTLTNATIGGDQFYDGTDSGKTKGNKAKSGGGVYIEGSGTSVTMNGGSIQYNKTIDGKGGGVYIKGDGTSFTMNGGKITQCKADVTSPSSSAGRGGGIYGDNTSSRINITIKGSAEISNNESTCQETASGGGIYGGFNSIITVSENATIKNNKAKGFGGGVYIKDTFKFTGGTITGNTITLGPNKLGTGIFSEDSSTTLEMSGNARVTNDNDIYLSSDSVITITGGALTGTPPVARITVPDNKYLTSTQVLTAGAGVTLANETYKFAVTPQTSPTPQPWTVGGNGFLKQGRYTEVPYGQLETYLANASATEVNYIEVTGISAGDLKGTYASPPNPGPLGALLNNNSSKKVALKLPNSISGLTDMSACFSQCENLVSLENFPSGVTDMRACFYGCENLTTVPAIPATVTSMMECFRYCRSLTTVPNIPSEVYDMTRCFQYCEKLQSIKMNCPYRVNFNGAFSGCDALPNGGIKVPSLYLAIYKANAGTMGTTKEKFAGF